MRHNPIEFLTQQYIHNVTHYIPSLVGTCYMHNYVLYPPVYDGRNVTRVYISHNTNALHVITTSIACKYLLQDEMMRDSEDDCWISDTNTTLKS